MNDSQNETDFPYFSIDEFVQFPSPDTAVNGIVASGGNLSPGMLLSAYRQGIFPWFNEDDPVLWWSPSPRFVLVPDELHVPSRLERFMKRAAFTYTADTSFEAVITACAASKRLGQNGTWITKQVIDAYCELFRCGYAHSFETRLNGKLVGGFYGVLLGSVFFGESMFSVVNEASKCAFCRFVRTFARCGGQLVDSQVYTDHVARFGGKNISREVFLHKERELFDLPLRANVGNLFTAAD